MKRFLASALIVGVSTFGLVGCDQTTTEKKTDEVNTPSGKVKATTETKIEKSGDAKDPAPSTDAPK
jgi:hypothetical protein